MTDPKAKKSPEPRRVLGRGLDALLPAATAAAAAHVEQQYQQVAIERVQAQEGQPRKRFEPTALEELAESIRQQGIIQPIVVRRAGERFEIVAGERRWRAAQKAGLTEVPVVIKDVAPSQAFELALVENIQRADLDPLETAEAYQRLIAEHEYTQEDLALRLGKSRTAVTNTLRMLQLPEELQSLIASGELSEGHGRALLGLKDTAQQVKLGREIAQKKLSVRETEAATRKLSKPVPETAAEENPSAPVAKSENPNARELERQLAHKLGMNVVVRDDPGKSTGVVEIAYDTLEQLDRLLEKLLGHGL